MPDCPCESEKMGLGSLGLGDALIKRKNQWLFRVRGINNDPDQTILALPPRKGSKPVLGWKEYDFQHLVETIHYPLKPAWEPIEITLYDLMDCNSFSRCHPIYEWIRSALSPLDSLGRPPPGMYNPQVAFWRPIVPGQLKRTTDIIILSGGGEIIEHWVLDNTYPQHVRWGELDMDSTDAITCDVVFRYDRAYCIDEGNTQGEEQPPAPTRPPPRRIVDFPGEGPNNPRRILDDFPATGPTEPRFPRDDVILDPPSSGNLGGGGDFRRVGGGGGIIGIL